MSTMKEPVLCQVCHKSFSDVMMVLPCKLKRGTESGTCPIDQKDSIDYIFGRNDVRIIALKRPSDYANSPKERLIKHNRLQEGYGDLAQLLSAMPTLDGEASMQPAADSNGEETTSDNENTWAIAKFAVAILDFHILYYYAVALESARFFGVTQSRAFVYDFGPGVSLERETYPPLPLVRGVDGLKQRKGANRATYHVLNDSSGLCDESLV
ncbi:hypothetical protein BDN70DRAFT_918441 [Pholiota conissans]|uniref:Uncharacterized protein n=1 Tax=Pholiota conissans TaxID=109636 RepID=A0A9P6D4T0_9AGAR|nr:hypothetical protein BDN70DRAFT_918441 [Pholiota conissans]